MYRNAPGLPGCRIVNVQFAVQFVHDAPLGVRSRPAHVPSLLARDPLRLLGTGVVPIQIQDAVPIRNEVHIVPDPHRVAVRANVIRDLFRPVAVEVKEIQVLSPTALIALPSPEVAKQRRVGHALAIRRDGARTRFGNRQGGRQATLHRNGVQFPGTRLPVVPGGPEQHPFPVRSPSVDMVVVAPAGRERPARRIVGQLPRLTALRRDHIDLLVAVVLAGERDPPPGRIEFREELEAGVGGEANRAPALIRNGPNVARMDEDDPIALDVRKSQKLGLGTSGQRQQKRKQTGSKQHLADSNRPPTWNALGTIGRIISIKSMTYDANGRARLLLSRPEGSRLPMRLAPSNRLRNEFRSP